MMLVGGIGLSIEFRWDGSRFRCPRSLFKEFTRKRLLFSGFFWGEGIRAWVRHPPRLGARVRGWMEATIRLGSCPG